MVHLHLHIIGVEGALWWVVSETRVGRWIRNDWGVVGTGARVPNDHMTFFEVLDERMKVVQLETTTRVITALWNEMSQGSRWGAKIKTNHVLLSSDDIEGV